MPNIKVIGPKSITLPTELGGDSSIYGLVVVCATRGIFVSDVGESQVQLQGITDTSLLSVDVVRLLASNGCEVLRYPAYFVVDDMDAEVPEGFPNRTKTELVDENDPESGTTETAHTWTTWGQKEGGSEFFTTRNGVTYRTSQDRTNRGEPIPSSAWVPASLAGLGVVASLPEPAEEE